MRYRFPAYYRRFICTGAECRDTCCGGWKIEIDENSYRDYKKVLGAFGKRLSDGIDHRHRCFLTEQGKCVFLNQDGWCEIYKELGHDGLCRACRVYPRHMEDYGELREIMLSLSCPEAAAMILGDEHQSVWIEKKREKSGAADEGTVDRKLLAVLEDVRHTMICLLRNRSVCFGQRLAMLLAFSHDVQRRLDDKKNGDLTSLSARYLASDAPARFAERLVPCQGKPEERMIRIGAMVRDLAGLEPVVAGWGRGQEKLCHLLYHSLDMEAYEKLRGRFAAEASGMELEWENLVLYFLYTYLLGAVYDGDVCGKVKFALYSYLMIRETCLGTYQKSGCLTRDTLVDAAYRYSREVENSDRNLKLLETKFGTSGLYGMRSLMAAVMG